MPRDPRPSFRSPCRRRLCASRRDKFQRFSAVFEFLPVGNFRLDSSAVSPHKLIEFTVAALPVPFLHAQTLEMIGSGGAITASHLS